MAFRLVVVATALWGYGSSASSDPWILSTNQFIPNRYQSSPYVANGYFGQRLPAEGIGYWVYQDNSTGDYQLNCSLAAGSTKSHIWNYFRILGRSAEHYAHHCAGQLETGGESVISGIPDWTGLTVTTESGQTFKPGIDPSTVQGFMQSFSIRNGIVQTNVTWNPLSDKTTYQLNYTVVAHRARLNLGIVRLDLSADQDVRLKITDILDGAGAVRADFHDKSLESDATIWTSVKPSGIDYCTAYLVSTVKSESTSNTSLDDLRQAFETRKDVWDWRLKRGDTLTIYKFVGIGSTAAFPTNTLSIVKDAAILARSTSWDELITEHTEKWDAVWDDVDIVIPGDQDLQFRTRASLFHILANLLPEDAGLTGNSISVGGYQAILTLYAASINKYRGRLLNQAIENAQYYNFSGALYPWTSGRFGNCTGTGVCKGYQYHINTDIALAHWQYFQQTNDLGWLAKRGWPIINKIAEMFAAYVVHNSSTGKYETIKLGEPDEFAYNINNGAYTNVGIKQLLGDWAPSAANRLNLEVPKNWSYISQNMYIPYNEMEKIIIEFDGMDGTWMTKQASTGLIHYPLQFQFSDTQARNDVAYYSSVNTADGPAMTWSIYAISEAQLQQKGCAAYTYLQRSSESYIRQPFYQFSETQLDTQAPGVDNPAFIFGLNPAFPFLTGAGGFLQVLTHGLTGMRPNINSFYLDPMLPPQLSDGIQIKGMKWQNATFDLAIEMHNTTITRRQTSSVGKKHVILEILGGNPAIKEYRLSAGESIVIPTRRPDISHAQEDLALCRPVGSDTEWVAGNYPYAIVDGSNSTVWQPATPQKASVVIDIGKPRKISKVILNWGAVPPSTFSLSGCDEAKSGFKELFPTQKVEISAPYDAQRARIVRERQWPKCKS
ncbi:hypothetical protein TrVFT333_006374 [Trichoderma virens FT-333]|nr:hypothetical protein TrVFT333_006374 [Trichoderma virens FT-333]